MVLIDCHNNDLVIFERLHKTAMFVDKWYADLRPEYINYLLEP